MGPGVDQKRLAILPRDPGAVMSVPLAFHPIAEPGIAQQFHGAVFKHAGADAPLHVVLALPLDHDAVDAVAMQHMREQHAGGSAADDGDLGAFHGVSPLSPSLLCDAGLGYPRVWQAQSWRSPLRAACSKPRPGPNSSTIYVHAGRRRGWVRIVSGA